MPAPYTPATDPTVLAWWSLISAGAVSSWVDQKAAANLAQATGTLQPTASNTGFAGTSPGVTSDGGDVLVGAVPAIAGHAGLTLVVPMIDASTVARIAFELTADTNSNDGAFFLSPNTGGAGRLTASIRGTTGVTSSYITEALTVGVVISVGYAFSVAGAGAIAFIRVNGVAGSLTNTTSASAAGVSANSNLHAFGRGPTPTVPWPGSIGQNWGIRAGVAQDAGLTQFERYCGATVGIVL